MTIKTRMIIGIAGAIFFLLASNLVTQFLINETNRTVDQIIKVNGVKLSLLNNLKSVSDERAVLQRNLVLVEDPERQAEVKKGLDESAKQIFNIFERLNQIKLDKRESELYEALKSNVSSANAVFGSFMMAVDEEFTEEAIDILMNDFQKKYLGFTKIVKEFRDYEVAQNSLAVSKLYQEQNKGQTLIWSWLAISVVLFSLVGWFVARSFLRPINAIVSTVDTISKSGDLSHRVQVYGKDELAQVSIEMNDLFSRMDRAITDVVEVMQEIAQGRFERRVEVGKKGQFLLLKDGVNQSLNQIDGVMSMLQQTANNFRSGELDVAKSEAVELKGTFSDVLYDLDRSAVQMRATLESIAQTLNALSLGDFSVRSEVDARGDFIPLKESINTTLNDLEQFVDEVASVQAKISEGDLTQKVKGSYKGKMAVLKDSMNSSVSNTEIMVGKVGAIASCVADGADGLAKGNEQISHSIQQQAAALEETSATMEEMTSTVRQNADNAQQANHVTGDAQKQLAEGLKTMQEALESMTQMSAASQKINDIITIIDGIAFQTNLLALNAAVEAARAGEHGRGFAVVAGEVRNLAGKSAEAAGEIKGLIENSVKISQTSGHYVQQTSDVMGVINDSMQTVGQMISEISQASIEQAQGIEQVNQTISSMDQMTQRNASVVEKAAESSGELLSDAEMLRDQVASFTVDQDNQNRMQRLVRHHEASQFEKMIEAHQSWKSKIRGFVEGVDIGVTYETATDHTACALGQWYYGEGQAYMHLPLMQALGDEHMEMHQAIKQVMDAKQIDDLESVEAGLAAVDKHSEKVVELLYGLIDSL